MNQRIEDPRKRTINFVIGMILALLHVAYLMNYLKSNWRFDSFLGTALMESCLKAGFTASCIAIVVTVAVLILAKLIKSFPSLLMVLIGNYLCPIVFFQVFQPLFFRTVETQWVSLSGVPDPRIIPAELLKLFAVNSYIGLFAGLFVSMALVAVLANNRKVETR